MTPRNRWFVLALLGLFLVLGLGGPATAQTKEEERVKDAVVMFEEIMEAPDSGIPRGILDKAEAIAIFPGVLRAGFGFGGQWGRGLISVRNRETGAWSAPAFLTIAGGSVGAQFGGQSIDLILVIMDRTGVQRLLNNQFKLGGEASVAAGPVGRSAEASTDIQLRAKILSYSRSRGLFAGIAINGSTMRSDTKANGRFYGTPMKSREVIEKMSSRDDLPAAVVALRETLSKFAG
jgi:lipid-binding SYLF domain-containing protein